MDEPFGQSDVNYLTIWKNCVGVVNDTWEVKADGMTGTRRRVFTGSALAAPRGGFSEQVLTSLDGRAPSHDEEHDCENQSDYEQDPCHVAGGAGYTGES